MIGGSRGTRARKLDAPGESELASSCPASIVGKKRRRKRESEKQKRESASCLAGCREADLGTKKEVRRDGSMEFGSLSQAHSEPKAKVDLHTHLFLNPTLPTIPVVGSSDFVRHEEPARHL